MSSKSSVNIKETKSKGTTATAASGKSNSNKTSAEEGGVTLDSTITSAEGGVDYEAMKRKGKHNKHDELEAERQVFDDDK